MFGNNNSGGPSQHSAMDMAGGNPGRSAPCWRSPYSNPELEYVYLGYPQTPQGAPQAPLLQPEPVIPPIPNNPHIMQPTAGNVYGDGFATAVPMPGFIPVPGINLQAPPLHQTTQRFTPAPHMNHKADTQTQLSHGLYPLQSDQQFDDIWSTLDSDLLDPTSALEYNVTPEDISMVEAYAPPGFDRSHVTLPTHSVANQQRPRPRTAAYNSWAMTSHAMAEEAQSSNRAGAGNTTTSNMYAHPHPHPHPQGRVHGHYGDVMAQRLDQAGFGPGVAAAAKEYGGVVIDPRLDFMDVAMMGDTISESVSSTSPASDQSHPHSQIPYRFGSHRDPSNGLQRNPGFQGNAGHGLQGNAGNGMQRNPGNGMQGNPGNGMQGNPGNGMQRNPGNGMQGNPGNGMQGNPGNGMRGNAGNGMQSNPGNFRDHHAGNGMQGNPGNFRDHHAGVQRSSRPENDFREQTQSNAMAYGAGSGYHEPKSVASELSGTLLVPGASGIRHLGEPRWAEQLLNLCAAAIASQNISRTQHLMWVLNDLASVGGDANQRFAAYGLRALFCRITGRMEAAATFMRPRHHDQEVSFGPKTVHRALVKFHEYVPWHQNCYSITSQTLLEVCAGKSRLHLIDIGAGKGIEWPIFIDALVSRSGGPPSILRMTMIRDLRREELNIGTAKSVNSEAADFMTRLVKFASLLGLHVEVNMVQKPLECVTREDLKIRDGEILAVVGQFRLHRLSEEPPARVSNSTPPRLSPRDEFLRFLYKLEPDVFILSDNDSDHCSHDFLTRFQSCIGFWWLCYESMDLGYAGRDPEERQILEYEGSMMLLNTVACEGIARIERNESYDQWQRRITGAGFVPREISEETKKASQNLVAYHSEFWNVAFVDSNVVSLQWRKQPTTFTSVWKTASSCSKPSCKCSMLHS